MRTVLWPFILAALLLTVIFSPSWASEYIQLSGAIDTRTVFSDGELSVDELTRLAQSRDMGVVVFTDHDRLVMEYGLFPLQHLIRKRESLNSIHESGLEAYLAAIDNARRRFPNMVLIPGCESVPYYYWTGSYFSGDLTAHDHEKRILAVGLERPEDYENMPVLHNGFSTRHIQWAVPQLLIFFGAFIIGAVMVRQQRRMRRAGVVVCLASLLLMANTMPFRSSPYDPYMGDRGIAPYQRYIDYVASAGGLTFWNYPETRSGVRRLGPIQLHTPPYPEVLEEAVGYTGFAAIYGDTITVTEPGREWDRVLLAYCRGRRSRPVWGISTADYHSESGAGGILGNFPTVFLVREKSERAVLNAMGAGRMYAVRGRYPQQMALKTFTVSGGDSARSAVLGEEIIVDSAPVIRIAIASRMPEDKPVRVRLIRGGETIRTFQEKLPFREEIVDPQCPVGQKTFYRVDVKGPAGRLVSNPVFATVRQP